MDSIALLIRKFTFVALLQTYELAANSTNDAGVIFSHSITSIASFCRCSAAIARSATDI